MKRLLIAFVALALLFGFWSAAHAQVTFPSRGGTGTSTIPTAGQVLVGQANGTYAPQATSTLGISGGGGGGTSLSGGATGTLAAWTSGTTIGPTSSPTVASINASGTATSTYQGGLSALGLYARNWLQIGSEVITNFTSYVRGLFSDTVTGLTLSNGVLSTDPGYSVPLTASTTEGSKAYASTTALTASSPLSYNDKTTTFSIQQVTATLAGYLSAADYLLFGNKLGTTSIDTLAELEAIQGGTNIIQSTEIDTSAELAGLLTDETGSGKTVFQNGASLSTTSLASTTLTASTTIQNATSSTFYATSLGINSEYFTDLTGSGLAISGAALNCATANGTTFGCLQAADFAAFANKIATTSFDTSAELASILSDETGSGAAVFGTNSSQASTTLTGSTTIQNGTTTTWSIANALTFGGVTATTWAAFCTAITGGSGLCDGVDDTSAGGSGLSGGINGLLAAWTGTSTLAATTTPTVSTINASSTTGTSTFQGAVQIGPTPGNNLLKVIAAGSHTASLSSGAMVNFTCTNDDSGCQTNFSNHGAGATARLLTVQAGNTAFDQETVSFQSSSDSRTTLGLIGQQQGQAVLKTTHNGSGSDANAALFSGDMIGTSTASAVKGLFLTSSATGTIGDLVDLRNILTVGGSALQLFSVKYDGKLGLASSTPGARLAVNGDTYLSGSVTLGGNVTATGTLNFNSETFNDLTGLGLINSGSALTCATGNVSTFGCLPAADFLTFGNKLGTTSLDTIAELESILGGTNVIINTEIDTSAEIAAILTDETGTGANVFGTNATLSSTTLSASTTLQNATSTTLFSSIASSTNAYTTNASTTNLSASKAFSFAGTTGTTWSDFCVAVTGGSGLCDGNDATGGGGGLNFGQTFELTTLGQLAPTTTRTLAFSAFLSTSTTATSSVLAGGLAVGSTTPFNTSLFMVGTSSPILAIDRITGKVGIGCENKTNARWTFGCGTNTNVNPNINLIVQDPLDARIGAVVADQGTFLKSSGGLYAYDYNLGAARTLVMQEFGGLIDMASAAAIKIINSAAPVFGASGEIAVDTTDNMLMISTSTAGAAVAIPNIERHLLWSRTIASTSVDFVNGGRFPLPEKRDAFTLEEIHCYVDSGTSVVINLSNGAGTADTETLTCDSNGAQDLDITSNATYAANASTSIEIGAITGAVDYLNLSVYGSWTAE